ncbi:uncharacterized protein LOC113336863 isoform X2 [Papaver somniferum]|uniref:uncharacterized protein LOC113336863 isoform X2 n=1 Tax=Papaver somniferum TaxID=3469 RepID=UPI000E6FBD6B|nr:uncharacterized protein LOC113336863 isoform X2 [Papaver somniferum]
MGFSLVNFMGSQLMQKEGHQKFLKFDFIINKRRDLSSSLKLPKSRIQSGRILMCKGEAMEFEKRTSPNEVAMLLNCTSWSGVGPGLMDAATRGALQAGKPVGGFKIAREAGEWTASNFHPYLATGTYLTCRFFSARKHGLVDAAVRRNASERTAVIALPGGIGTLDEIFEILALIQLQRIGSALPVPFILMNYDSFYSKLFEFLDECEVSGAVSKGEVASLWKICSGNSEALKYLAEFYDLPQPSCSEG